MGHAVVNRSKIAMRAKNVAKWRTTCGNVSQAALSLALARSGDVAVGTNDGNEYEGARRLKRLLRDLRIEDVIGSIILVPVLNTSELHAGQRESTDDGVNLNRAFVDGAGKTPALSGITHRIAA